TAAAPARSHGQGPLSTDRSSSRVWKAPLSAVLTVFQGSGFPALTDRASASADAVDPSPLQAAGTWAGSRSEGGSGAGGASRAAPADSKPGGTGSPHRLAAPAVRHSLLASTAAPTAASTTPAAARGMVAGSSKPCRATWTTRPPAK